ncbi:MAG TPA: hypothetical protein VKD28_09245 [Gemmatimonadales bacterium]|nr:hypothetical protein [Gemmatimonadales bacterium]
MSAIMIRDLPCSKELDRKGMSAVRGGLSPLVNLENVGSPTINVNQNITAAQLINVAVLNDSIIGAGFGFHLNLAPKLPLKNVVVI